MADCCVYIYIVFSFHCLSLNLSSVSVHYIHLRNSSVNNMIDFSCIKRLIVVSSSCIRSCLVGSGCSSTLTDLVHSYIIPCQLLIHQPLATHLSSTRSRSQYLLMVHLHFVPVIKASYICNAFNILHCKEMIDIILSCERISLFSQITSAHISIVNPRFSMQTPG